MVVLNGSITASIVCGHPNTVRGATASLLGGLEVVVALLDCPDEPSSSSYGKTRDIVSHKKNLKWLDLATMMYLTHTTRVM